MDEPRGARLRDELSMPGFVIGIVGCVILTAASAYTALKLGSLPWPTIFTSITALLVLRACGRHSVTEANVTQIVMSAGSMVAGGLAFTIPGAWMLGLSDGIGWMQMLMVAVAGTLLGLVCTMLIRRRFVDNSDLEYPIGTAAAETLKAAREGGSTGRRLFASMGIAGAWAVLRDGMHLLPARLFALDIPGVAFGLNNSPMWLSMGFLVGFVPVSFWLASALFANFGLVVGASSLGLWSVEAAGGIVRSLGMGLMMGAGLGVVVKDVLYRLVITRLLGSRRMGGSDPEGRNDWTGDIKGHRDIGMLALLVAAATLIVGVGLGLGPVPTVLIVLLSFVTTTMSAQSVGQTGVDPMEVFGLIVLLCVAAVSSLSQVGLFLVAGIITVTCGLAGDVMADFKTGALLGNNPRVLWKAQALGATVGVFVSVATMVAIRAAYGADAFGLGKEFVSTQASVVATMVTGVPSVPAFAMGLASGVVLYCMGLPAIMMGLGVYLPFYMSVPAFLGGLVKLVLDGRARHRSQAGDERADDVPQGDGIVVASGVLGGESIVGVVIALATILGGMG